LIAMMARLIRLLALLAVLMLPLGMAQASRTTDHLARHSAMTLHSAAAASNHCGMPGQLGAALPGHCTMACASMLPAVFAGPSSLAATMIDDRLVNSRVPEVLHSLVLEIATPPPRAA
jgi:hypothetical protein